MLIKIAYVATNIGTFILLDFVLNGAFRYYGYRWIIWVKSENSVKFDYAGMSNHSHTKPGKSFLWEFNFILHFMLPIVIFASDPTFKI